MLAPEPPRFREGKALRNWALEGLTWFANQRDVTGRRRRGDLAPEAFAASALVLTIHYPHAMHMGSRVLCPVCRTPYPCATARGIIDTYPLHDPLDDRGRRPGRPRKDGQG